jgi:hypothetical protein
MWLVKCPLRELLAVRLIAGCAGPGQKQPRAQSERNKLLICWMRAEGDNLAACLVAAWRRIIPCQRVYSGAMEDLGFKIVRTDSGDELIARIGNYEIARQHSRRRFLVYPDKHRWNAPRRGVFEWQVGKTRYISCCRQDGGPLPGSSLARSVWCYYSATASGSH